MSVDEPGSWLVTHEAPDGLLAPPAPRSRRPVGAAVAVAAALILGIGLGRTVLAPASDPSTEARASMRPVQLVYTSPEAARVEVAGSFNDWQRAPLVETRDGVFTIILNLEPGEYEYQFVVDGQDWVADPLAVHSRSDGFGAENSVLTL